GSGMCGSGSVLVNRKAWTRPSREACRILLRSQTPRCRYRLCSSSGVPVSTESSWEQATTPGAEHDRQEHHREDESHREAVLSLKSMEVGSDLRLASSEPSTHVPVRPYSAAPSLFCALSRGACVSSGAIRSSASSRSRWMS